MKRRDFNKLLLTGMAIPSLGLMRDGMAYAQTANGGLTSLLAPEPPMLVLSLNQQQPTIVVGSKMFESLLDYDFDLTPRPQLAASWEISEDGRTYTFHLVKNAKWHDGVPFTAHDVVFNCSVMLMELHPRARTIFERCESIAATDDHTVVFKLKEPFAPFIYAFEADSAPMAPKHIYEGTDYKNNPANEHPIGTGPFMFKEWARGSHIHLIANPDYYLEGKPSLTEIFFRIVPDAASRSVALETGEAQLAGWNDVENFDVQRLAALPHLEFTTKGYEFASPLLWYEVNLRKAPFNDLRFRKAMMHLLDKNFIVERIMFGLAAPATGPIASTTKFFEPNLPRYDFDVEKANAILDEMGLKKGANGNRMTIRFLVVPAGEMWTRFAEYFRQAMAAGGIEVVLETTDIAGWGQSIANWEYEVSNNMLYQLADPAIGVARSYISSNIRKGILFTNTEGYENAEVDRLFAEAAVQTSEAARQERYSAVQRILVEELPVLWMTEQRYATLHDKRIVDLVVNASGVNSNFAHARYA
ncbi:ABC transporter substrate-binding protein [Mesorhizobium mediterraneum]|uniref:ABC transporter substrate-binding protein n=1 Tax=Mesorhizobium mediterraneum TaxID=43617 RepID=UPI00177CAFB5|nr:ABC transporter substrate-binding protein [Mesorhizobium mediterraneum]